MISRFRMFKFRPYITVSVLPGRLRAHGLLAVATLALTACASMQSAPPTEQLRQRVTDRWQALMAYDYAKAYTFATPAYRASVSAESYRSRQGAALQRVSADIFSVDCPQPNQCKVRVVVGVKPPLSQRHGPAITAPVDETWLLEDGQWWMTEDN